MPKFKIVTGFELEIEGNSDDADAISKGIASQFSGLVRPATDIAAGEVVEHQPQLFSALPVQASGSRTTRRRKTSPHVVTTADAPDVPTFRHSPEKYGMPQQSWNTATKSIWLLYVVKDIGSAADLSAGQIAKTFNGQFRQAGKITPNNVSRDLGKTKTERPAPVNEDNSSGTSRWFLTDEGTRRAQGLIAEALTPTASDGAD